MRRPKLSSTQYAVAATVGAAMLILPMTGAQASFGEGDYELLDCGLDATLVIRSDSDGLTVETDGASFVHTERADGEVTAALVVDLGGDGPDDNTVVTVTSADGDGITCDVAIDVSDDDVARMVGLGDDQATNKVHDDATVDESDAFEKTSELATNDDADEATEKVELCHKPDGVNPHEIEISQDAVESHLAHGDLEGECPDELTNAKTERKDDRDAAKTERKDDRDAAKAERKDDRDAAKAERKGDDESDDEFEADDESDDEDSEDSAEASMDEESEDSAN